MNFLKPHVSIEFNMGIIIIYFSKKLILLLRTEIGSFISMNLHTTALDEPEFVLRS